MRPPPSLNPPAPSERPSKRRRATLSGDALAGFEVRLKTITPILGGSARPREVDRAVGVRAQSVRGHLRFWWRCLQLQDPGITTSALLHQRERALWGGASNDRQDESGRSRVEVRVECISGIETTRIDRTSPTPGGAHNPETPGFYALWTAREVRQYGVVTTPAAERFQAGVTFTLRVRCPEADLPAVKAAVRAWILFGGYGARTRRGLGALTVVEEGASRVADWLPANVEAIGAGFGVALAAAARARRDTPSLKGAALATGAATGDAVNAWRTGLAWVRDFRQAEDTAPPAAPPTPRGFAREKGATTVRPGRSNLPEADKIRNLSGRGPWEHTPRHNGTPAWPRAGFGLPINGQFQDEDRHRVKYRDQTPALRVPARYELRWRMASGEISDRLGSPLIIKPLPLANGQFVPCALWLHRAYPNGGQVVLTRGGSEITGSAAPFDRLVAPGDPILYAPLNVAAAVPPGQRLREAFLAWLPAAVQRRTL